VALNRK